MKSPCSRMPIRMDDDMLPTHKFRLDFGAALPRGPEADLDAQNLKISVLIEKFGG